ncbi:MAG TPA: hypothetical protein VIM11_24645 [Tepidisphaeraceae bacterium]|jgi:hypothetical protein
MTQTLPLCLRTPNAAHALAASNYAANRAALAALQPALAPLLLTPSADIDWIFARDGSLTAILPSQQWWGGCSLPRRAGQYMFKSLDIRGVVGCFLFPVHAAQVRISLDQLEAQQAIIAIIPDLQTLQIILHCEDFAVDFSANRLWFAAGENWESELAQIFVQNPGLPTPAEFIRAISPDNTQPDQLIEPAQKAFAHETTRRTALIQSLLTPPGRGPAKSNTPTLCVVAPSHFRLWNEAPTALVATLADSQDFTARIFDSDNPASASPLGLARQASGANAVLTANLGRADLPPVIPNQTPVLTWITLPRIPAYDPSAPQDGLLLTDPGWKDRATSLGWPQDRIRIAAWPQAAIQATSTDTTTGEEFAAFIDDTHPIVPPKIVKEFSSHLLLWDLIAQELARDPFQLKNDLDAYLSPRIAKFQIDPQSFDRSLFIERLIVPAYQQGLARALIAQKIPLRLFGTGWDQIESFAAHAAGPVESREHFQQIVAASGALVYAWPISHAHPIDAAGRPVIRPSGSRSVPSYRVCGSCDGGLIPSPGTPGEGREGVLPPTPDRSSLVGAHLTRECQQPAAVATFCEAHASSPGRTGGARKPSPKVSCIPSDLPVLTAEIILALML